MRYVVQVSNIKWDTDGAPAPSGEWVVVVDCDDEQDVEEAVSDKLSDDHGFCHKGFDMAITDRLVQQTVVVTMWLSLDNTKQSDPLEWDWQSLLDLGPDEEVEVAGMGDFTSADWAR